MEECLSDYWSDYAHFPADIGGSTRVNVRYPAEDGIVGLHLHHRPECIDLEGALLPGSARRRYGTAPR